ncbi:MAG: hypothetical protein ABII82_08150 [Verrucomicrobiota bacterium]
MGAKYQPSKRDLKANRSFLKKQPAQSRFIRPTKPIPDKPADKPAQD